MLAYETSLVTRLLYILVQVRGLLGGDSHEAQTGAELAERAQTVLRETEAACSPAPELLGSGSFSLTGSPDNAARSLADQVLPVWRSHGLTALLRSLQSEFSAAEKALAAALNQQRSGKLTSHGESIEWSKCAMREVASVD